MMLTQRSQVRKWFIQSKTKAYIQRKLVWSDPESGSRIKWGGALPLTLAYCIVVCRIMKKIYSMEYHFWVSKNKLFCFVKRLLQSWNVKLTLVDNLSLNLTNKNDAPGLYYKTLEQILILRHCKLVWLPPPALSTRLELKSWDQCQEPTIRVHGEHY